MDKKVAKLRINSHSNTVGCMKHVINRDARKSVKNNLTI